MYDFNYEWQNDPTHPWHRDRTLPWHHPDIRWRGKAASREEYEQDNPNLGQSHVRVRVGTSDWTRRPNARQVLDQ